MKFAKVNLVSGKRLFYNVVFFLCFFSLFILNNNRKDPSNLVILNSLLTLFTLVFIVLLPIGLNYILKWRLSVVHLFLISLLVLSAILCFISRQYIIVHWLYLLIYLLFLTGDKAIELSKPLKMCVSILCFTSMVVQLFIFDLDGRPVLSYIDTNYSSMMIFLFGMFCFYKVDKKLAICVLALGIITLSRAYLLVVFCFVLLTLLQRNNTIEKMMLYFTKPIVSFLLIVSLPLAINFYFVANHSVEDLVVNTAETKLSGSMVDRSNFDRSMASVMFVTEVILAPQKYMFGVNLDNYLENIFRNSPHHSILQMMLNYGWAFTIPYSLLFFSLARHACRLNKKLLPFYLSYFIYLMTLGGGIFGMPVVLLAFILAKTDDAKNVKQE